MLARSLSVLLAIVVCAWFALSIRQVNDTSQATSILSGHSNVTPAMAVHAGALLHSAGTLNPDSQVDLLRAQVAMDENDRPRAVRIVEDVVHREPMNIVGWLQLAETTRNVPEIKRAVARVGALDPRLTLGHF